MDTFKALLSELSKALSYEDFRCHLFRFLCDCYNRQNYFDDFENTCELMLNKNINQEWLFRVYCEIFANNDYISINNKRDRDLRFFFYINSIENLLYIAENNFESSNLEDVTVAEKIFGFFFSFLDPRRQILQDQNFHYQFFPI